MPDNITAPSAGTSFATDEIGGVHFPRTKVSFGADGEASDVSSANPLPVVMPAGYATQATLASILAKTIADPATAAAQTVANNLLAGIEVALEGAVYFPATQPVSGTVGITGTVPVSGTFFPATQPVSIAAPVAVTGTFFQATQPVSAAALPLPAGAATAVNQTASTAAITKLGAAKRWFPITPADSALATVPDAIYIGGAGNIVARGNDAVDATFAVTAGEILPISPAQIRVTGTTATGLIGLIS